MRENNINKNPFFPHWAIYLLWLIIVGTGIIGLIFRFDIIMNSKLNFEYCIYIGWFIVLICPFFSKIKFGGFEVEVGKVGTESSNKEIPPSKDVEKDKKQEEQTKPVKVIPNMFRTSIMLIFSKKINYFVRESYCKEALKEFFKGDEFIIDGFGSNLVPIPDGTNQDDKAITRVHFYIYTKNQIRELNELKDTIGNYYNKQEKIKLDNPILTDWVIVCE